jgi:hypothetical protein
MTYTPTVFSTSTYSSLATASHSGRQLAMRLQVSSAQQGRWQGRLRKPTGLLQMLLVNWTLVASCTTSYHCCR